MNNPTLRFNQISKRFPGVRALHEVSFDVRAGSVHALLGENGAGKSTLLKILSGMYKPSAGQIEFGGESRQFHSTADAIAAGIAVIYQELHLVPQLSVAENLYLGRLPNRFGWVDRRGLRQRALSQLDLLGEKIDPNIKLGRLSIGQQQMVEIAKALARDAKVIAFDEPTSSLSARETQRLFAVIAQLKAAGKVILYVSHRMDEIYATCDAATVLRDGQHVQTYDTLSGITRDELVRKMVGRSIDDVFGYTPRPSGAVALDVSQLTGPGLTAPASFSVQQGQILGFFGLVGAGRTELMKLIYGAVQPTSGTIQIGASPVIIRSPADAIRRGLVLCPEDRKKEGIIPVASVMENLNLSGRRHFSPLGVLINETKERANAASFVKRLSVKTPSLAQPIRNLSGGNQQKVILARWLCENPKVVLFDEPTRGIDVGAKSEIYSIIYDLARRGAAIVVISSELPEAIGICDAIIVMRQGRIVGRLDRSDATQERLLAMALPSGEPQEQTIAPREDAAEGIAS